MTWLMRDSFSNSNIVCLFEEIRKKTILGICANLLVKYFTKLSKKYNKRFSKQNKFISSFVFKLKKTKLTFSPMYFLCHSFNAVKWKWLLIIQMFR